MDAFLLLQVRFKMLAPLPASAAKGKNLKTAPVLYLEGCLGTGVEFNSYSRLHV